LDREHTVILQRDVQATSTAPSTPLRSVRDDWVIDHVSKLVRPVRAEDELELQKNGIDLAISEEEVRFQKIVIVLQS
jgi:hypothetical protein